jgi:hypothetical protein
MKKVKEMNGHEKIAYRNIKGIFNWEVGGWYNCILDDCIEEIPDTLEQAKEIVRDESMNDYAREGMYSCNNAPIEMRFAGNDFINEVIDWLFEKDDDAQEIAEVKGWTL